jgi:predicted amidohydrolase
MAEREGSRVYNAAVLSTPEGGAHIYRKMHLFFREKELFDRGNLGFRVFTWRRVRIGLMVCFDWIFPESARLLALGGCQIICHPSNLVMPFCQDAMITRALENRVYCITANRVGTEGRGSSRLVYTGGSQIVDPRGDRLVRFGGREHRFRGIKIDPKTADTKKVNRFNDIFADRRAEWYAPVGRRSR